jgi:hypothetical protein
MLGSSRYSWVLAGTVLAFSLLSLPAQDVVISELMAVNDGSLLDEDGESSDWLEIHNRTSSAVSLSGWYLTDDTGDPRKWRFPDVVLSEGAYLVVFASAKDRAAAGSPLHTNFKLTDGGEYLGLFRPDGVTVEHQYSPRFPRQRPDISYGLAAQTWSLVAEGQSGEYLVPVDGSLGLGWTASGFVPGAAWKSGPTGLGFFTDTGGGGPPPETVSLWNLDGDLVDEARGNALTYLGGAAPAYVAGFDGTPGGAISLGGADYLQATHTNGLPIYAQGEYTVALRVKGMPQADKRVFSEGSSRNTSPLFTIGTANDGATGAVDIFIRTASGDTIMNHVKSSRTAFDGTWHHVAWVDRSGDAAVYVDGVRDSTSFSYTKPDLPLDITSIGAVLRATACCWFTGAIDQVVLLDIALTDGEVAELAAGGWIGEGNPYGDLISTDVGAAMRDVNSGLYLRLPFVLDDPSAFDSLILRMKYEDGFVAYLNGTEVARRNAPAVPAWSSAATAERLARDARSYEEISIAESIPALKAGANVLAIHGLNLSTADGDFLLLPELVAAATLGTEPRYFREPTPGLPNGGGVIDFVEDTKFSTDRGFRDEPFSVEITSATPGATIRYTLDQSAPSAGHGEIYTGPILIDRTTTLRAVAVKDGYEPTSVDTQTYIFLDDVLVQPARPAGYPTTWEGYPADYAMDPEICTDQGSAHYDPSVKEALRSLPTLSLVVDRDDLMGSSRGMYTHALSRGLAWERPASVELIDPDRPGEGFQVNCGVRMQGGSSARPGEGKHSFRLLFKSIYGASKLDYPLFKDCPVETFDTITLRCFSTDSWHFKDGGSRYRRWDSQFIRDIWMRDSQLAMGHLSSHATYVHLYLNGMYWGIYNPSERPDDSFQTAYQGGQEEEWDVMKDFNELFRGTRAAWDAFMSQAGAGLGTMAAYQRIQGRNPDGSPNPAYPVFLDEENLIDYMILHFYACSEDWPHHNWYGARNRTGTPGGWKFFVWDQEIVLDFVFRDRINVSNENSPAWVYSKLRANPEFRMHFADRVHRHLFGGGALTDEEAKKRWLARADEIDRAVVGESARWGDYRMDVPDPSSSPAELYTREDHWLVEKAKVLGQYIPESHRLALERFRANDLYPPVEAPSFQQHGGLIVSPFRLEITAPAGTIYYTLDGTDPRLPGGEVASQASVVGGSTVEVLISSGAPCRALVPAGGALGLTWTSAGFDDSSWRGGTTGVGFEGDTGFETLLGLDAGTEMEGINASVFIRIPFSVAVPASVEQLTLRMKYDDGFVAYINGQEVAGANAPADLQWNSQATTSHADAEAVIFQDFDISAAIPFLASGANLLAIHGLNSSAGSSDMLILPELVSSGGSGSGIVLEGPTVVKARAFEGEWSALAEAFFYPDIPLRITEVMYHPRPGGNFDGEEYEFIELQNVGEASLDLSGCRVGGAVEFVFPEGFALAAKGVTLIVENPDAFTARYPTATRFVAGRYSGKLGNAGERIRLDGPAGEPILDFEYSDLWYPTTDGEGNSLVIVDPLAPRDGWSLAQSWSASAALYGSPGFIEGETPQGGWQRPGDATQDGSLDLSDAIRTLIVLFMGSGDPMPCAGELPETGGNLVVFDVNGDQKVNITDPIHLLQYLFLGGARPALGIACLRVDGCADVCK